MGEALVLHINKLRVLQGYGSSPSKATADEQAVESESQKATAGRSTESIRKATGHTDNVTEKGEDAADSNNVEEKEKTDEKSEEESDEKDSVEVPGLKEHPIQISLPLRITREIIDKLLPEREPS